MSTFFGTGNAVGQLDHTGAHHRNRAADPAARPPYADRPSRPGGFRPPGGTAGAEARKPAAFGVVQGARRVRQPADTADSGERGGRGVRRQSWHGGAAMRLGVPATIFLPSVTSPSKAERIKSYAANLVVAGERYADARAASEEFAGKSGALAVHAFDQPETLLGQGTIGCEIDADLPDIDTLLVAVGGGGLIGGLAAWFRDRVRIIAVEPEL